jgi:type II secretory pathway component PulF
VVRWLPGVPQIVHEQRLAGFAEMLASLLDAGVPLPDALSLSAAHLEDASLIRTTRELAQSFQSGREPAEDSAVAGSFPPFLRWAIFQADGAIGRARALRMAANVYRQSAQRRLGRMRVVVPLVACVVLGGGITLLYALALFVPVAQMIQGLAA